MGLKESGLTGTLLLTVSMTCFGSSFILGYNGGVLNLPSENVKRFIAGHVSNTPDDLSQDEENKVWVMVAFSNAAWVIGGAIGAFSCGWLADGFGRRNSLLINHFIAFVGAIISAASLKHYAVLFLGRFILGLNCGVTIGVASMYLMEIAPISYRGSIGACHQLAVTIGIFISYVVTLPSLLNNGGRWPWGIAVGEVPAVASLIILPFCPESPRFLLLSKKNEEAAKKAFERFNAKDDVNTFISEVKAEVAAAESQPKFQFGQLFTEKDLRMAVLIACLVQVLQQLSGINAVITYSSLMFKAAGVHEDVMPYCVCGIGLFNVILTIISLPLLDRAGRRTLLLWPTVLMAISLVVLTFTVNLEETFKDQEVWNSVLSIASIVFIFVYICGFALGLGPIPAMIVAEIFRQGPRAAAYSLSQALQWLSNLLVLLTYPSLNLMIGGYSFIPFLIVVVVCWVFFFLYMPETKNRTFDEIAQDLTSGKVVVGRQAQS
ncbi:unnamed protein product [Calicophoron daubneyi]|uniref:Major facilitator superfamily (MFS) profile domain-containing protein n=1 Tax=Calicophoron daubneyi TaxID=300641 RepID=A0AAV2TN24_CALDB